MSHLQNPGHFVADLTWTELDQYVSAGHTAILPVGAASKEHGNHLPLNTDFLQTQWLCEQLISELSVLIWPTLSYGFYPAFSRFPGSSSLTRATFTNLVTEVGAEILGNGHRRCVILNSGISTIEPLHAICASNPALQVIHIYSGSNYQQTASALGEQENGGHADELETSLLLHIAPERVRMEHARDESISRFQPGRLNRTDPADCNYTASGAMGNPTLATSTKGEQLAIAMLKDVTIALESPIVDH